MKMKITITGQKVQGVGYRPYLAELAMRLALRGFEVYNEGNNAVVVLIESDDHRCKEFFKSATLERPSLALVDNVKSEEYTGEVMPLWQFASINTATQINKAIPILLAVERNTDAILKETNAVHKDTSAILEEVKGIQPGFTVQFNQMQADIKAIKARLGMP